MVRWVHVVLWRLDISRVSDVEANRTGKRVGAPQHPGKPALLKWMAFMRSRGSIKTFGLKEAYYLMLLYPSRYYSPVRSTECIVSEGREASVNDRFHLSLITDSASAHQ